MSTAASCSTCPTLRCPTPTPRLRPASCPQYDNVLLSHADRRRIIPDEHRDRVVTNLGQPTVLVDGFVRGTWKITRARGTATLAIEPFEPLPEETVPPWPRKEQRLIRFITEPEDAGASEVRFAETT